MYIGIGAVVLVVVVVLLIWLLWIGAFSGLGRNTLGPLWLVTILCEDRRCSFSLLLSEYGWPAVKVRSYRRNQARTANGLGVLHKEVGTCT
jgi:hypothetical protein